MYLIELCWSYLEQPALRRCPNSDRIAIIPDADALAIRQYCRTHPELVYEDYDAGENPLESLCYPAAEAWYHLQDCESHVYCLNWTDGDERLKGTH